MSRSWMILWRICDIRESRSGSITDVNASRPTSHFFAGFMPDEACGRSASAGTHRVPPARTASSAPAHHHRARRDLHPIPSRRRMGCVWHAAARLPGILFRHVLVTEASERDGPAIVPGDSVSPERCGGYQPEAATQTNALGSSVNSS